MHSVTNGLVFGALAGILIGLWPLLKGLKANQQILAISGFFASIISGAILGLILCIPIAWIFAWQIKKKSTTLVHENNLERNTEQVPGEK